MGMMGPLPPAATLRTRKGLSTNWRLSSPNNKKNHSSWAFRASLHRRPTTSVAPFPRAVPCSPTQTQQPRHKAPRKRPSAAALQRMVGWFISALAGG